MKVKALLTIVVILLLTLVSCGGEKQESLVYVVVPSEEGPLAKEHFTPFADYLSEQVGQEVKLMQVTDYPAAIEAFKYGHADIARLSTVGYILVKDTEKIPVDALAVPLKVLGGVEKPSYNAIIITRADSDISDLNGVSFAYGDMGSTSGYWAPTTYFLEEGIELGEFFFAGAHAAGLEAVKNGTGDAGATADSRYNIAIKEGAIVEGELRILWESAPIFNPPIIVHSSMDAKLKEKLRQALLDAPRHIVEYTNTGDIGYVPVLDSDYDQIRKMLETKEQLK